MSNRFKVSAFTLIELLIVVAIIAILAAIAVPNFLEAQVRSKASRVKADMRSIATAIESYAVDWNKYPITSQWVDGPGAPPNNFNNRLRGITTPVAYMTSLPKDVFWNQEATFPITPGTEPTFEYSDYSTAVIGQNFPGLPSYNLFGDRVAMNDYYGRKGVVNWALNSAGPDRINDFQFNPDAPLAKPVGRLSAFTDGTNRTYDPTNGTISVGDISRTNADQRG